MSDSKPTVPTIHLDNFLKLGGLADTGGHAKVLIQGGEVKVNGQTETRRRRQLVVGDVVELGGKRLVVKGPLPKG